MKPTETQDIGGVSPPPDVTNHPNLRLLDHQICGPIIQPKVIGGNKTGVFEYPWMALIAYDTGRSTPEFRCGGTIISKRYILTAAHCVTELPAGKERNFDKKKYNFYKLNIYKKSNLDNNIQLKKI